MSEERTVLDHLLEGRDALQREVQRLTAAIEQLDSVLGRIGSTSERSDGSGVTPVADPVVAAPVAEAAAAEPIAAEPIPTEPVNPPAEVEAPVPATVRSRPRVTRKTPAKKSARSRTTSGEPPKSIRVHVLEMLQAENREFGLAEIIDRVHAAGIQAHDDAVRSITIKLMKDGRVERVGRGQYRLARRGSAARASAAVATAPRVTESAPEPQVADEQVAAEPAEPAVTESPLPEAPAAETATAETPAADVASAETPDSGNPDSENPDSEYPIIAPQAADLAGEPESTDAPADESERSEQPTNDAPPPPPYTPSLNLGQPWNS